MSLVRIQQLLKDMNHDPGPIDGLWGNRTKAALESLIQWEGKPLRVASTNSKNDELPWITEGKKVFGFHEVRNNAELRKWLRSDGKTLGDPKVLPWCGDFTETAIKNALPTEPFTGRMGENPYWARNWLEFGRSCPAIYGCIGVFSRGTGGHVGFLVGEDSTDYYVFGGNQSDSVNIVRIDKKRLLGTRWPLTYDVINATLPRRNPADVVKSVNEI
jgi:uncharacterized protein (TIGR02594 family)